MQQSADHSDLRSKILNMTLKLSNDFYDAGPDFYDADRERYFDRVYLPVLKKVIESQDSALLQELIKKVKTLRAEAKNPNNYYYDPYEIAQNALENLPYHAVTLVAASSHPLQAPAKEWLKEHWLEHIAHAKKIAPYEVAHAIGSPTAIRNAYKIEQFLRDFPALQDPELLESWMETIKNRQEDAGTINKGYLPISRELAKAQEDLATQLCQSSKTSVAVLEKLFAIRPDLRADLPLRIAQAKIRENQKDVISSQQKIFESKSDPKEKTRATQDLFYTATAQAAIAYEGSQSSELIAQCLQASPRSYTFLASREDLLQAALYRSPSDFQDVLQFFRSRDGVDLEPGATIPPRQVKNANSQDERFLKRLVEAALSFQKKEETDTPVHSEVSQNYILLLSETMARYHYKDTFLMRLMGIHFLDRLIMKTIKHGIMGHPDSLAIQGLLMTHVVDVRLAAKFALENPHCGYWQQTPSKLKDQMQRMDRMDRHSASRQDLQAMLLFVAAHREKHADLSHKEDYEAMVSAVLQNYQPGVIVRTLGTSAAYYQDVTEALEREVQAIQSEAKAAKRSLSCSETAQVEVLEFAIHAAHQKIFSLLPQGTSEEVKDSTKNDYKEYVSADLGHSLRGVGKSVILSVSTASARGDGYDIPIATAVVVSPTSGASRLSGT